MGILQWQANEPVQVQLKFPSGKHVEGKFGEQAMFSLLDGRVMYVPLIVEKQIQELGIKRGQPVEICKQQENGKTQWKVRRVQEKPVEEKPQPKPAARAASNAPDSNRKPQPAAELLDGAVSLDGPDVDVSPDAAQSQLEHALKIALQAAKRAERFSQEIGHPVQFDTSDIRLMAQTLVINNRGRAA